MSIVRLLRCTAMTMLPCPNLLRCWKCVPRDESPTEGMLKHTLDALLRTHITAFEVLWEQPERLPNGLWKWDVRHSMWVERQKVSRALLCTSLTLEAELEFLTPVVAATAHSGDLQALESPRRQLCVPHA